MGSVPHHPFFTLVIESLIPYDRNWKLPYVTVMYSTGPLFLSVIWQEYKRGRGARGIADGISGITGGGVGGLAGSGRWDGSEAGRVRILQMDEYNRMPWSFFRWHGGSSWHGDDARLIFWMGRHWMLLTAAGFLIAGIVGLGFWWVYKRVLLFGERHRRRKSGVASTGYQLSSSTTGWTDSIPFYRSRSSGGKGYELVDRHEV